MSQFNFKTCTSCSIAYPVECFSKRQSICRRCRSDKSKEEYNKPKLDERIPIRNEFFKICLSQGMSFENYNKLYIPFERLEKMKTDNRYSFCEFPDVVKKAEREKHEFEYKEKKYWLDALMCSDDDRNTAYIIHII
jgi:hypothetical protein